VVEWIRLFEMGSQLTLAPNAYRGCFGPSVALSFSLDTNTGEQTYKVGVMTRQEFMLAVLATAGTESQTPAQVQKLSFLIDRKIPEQVGGPWFAFQPCDYGPFDIAVYEELRSLSRLLLVSIEVVAPSLHAYRLTPQGLVQGLARQAELPAAAVRYIGRLSAWVRGLSFPALVTAIYREFPDMRANSVFQGNAS
jgi:hypothetical protein